MNRQDDQMELGATSPRAYGGLSSEQRRLMRRERLVEAGLEVFGHRGLTQSTMRDICTHARLSDRYFYESFGNVQDVFEAVYVHLRGQLLERLQMSMQGIVPSKAALTVAEAGLHAFFTFVKEDPRRARIMLIDVLGLRYSHLGVRGARGGRDGGAAGQGVFQVAPYVSLFSNFFRAVYPGVDDLGIDVELIHQTMIGMTVQSAAAWADKGFDKSVDDIVRHNLFAWEGLDVWVRRTMAERDVSAVDASRKRGVSSRAKPMGASKAKAA
jgi:AcrR family transcriptional regulator